MGLTVAVSTRALVDAFRSIVGGAQARDDRAAREAFAIDGVMPALVVAPASIDETASVVALAAAEHLAIVPRGSGTSLAQGRPAERVDLVLDLSRLDRVVEYNADDLTATVEAGVTAGSLAAILRARGQQLAVDPPGGSARTLGGLVATNASGPLRARYGTLRDLLLGVRFVQADGVLTWGGSKVVKSVTGYDVPKLMVGGLGTLGVLSELTLRLHALPEAEHTSVIAFASATAAEELALRILDSSLQPNRLEMGDAGVSRALGVEGSCALAVSFASVEPAVAAQAAEVIRLAQRAGALAVRSVPDLWAVYDRIWARDADATLLTLGSMPGRLAETFGAVAAASEALGSGPKMLAGGSAVIGSLRMLVRGAAPSAVARLIEDVRSSVSGWDGTVIVQGAPRDVRAAVDPWGPVPAEALAVMRALKLTFDPEGLLNPGRFVGGL